MNVGLLAAAAAPGLGDRLVSGGLFALSAIAALGVLILVHEYGHFIVARWCGVRVEKFSIGFGRKLAAYTRGETEYRISLIPLGGYVKFYGDELQPGEGDSDSFLNQPVLKRLAIVAAGPLFNLVLAALIYTVVAMYGSPEPTRVVDQVLPDSPAAAAGMLPGDRIDFIDGKAMEAWEEVVLTIRAAAGREITLDILREDGSRTTLTAVPADHEVPTPEGKSIRVGRIGIVPRDVIVRYWPHEALYYGVSKTWEVSALTLWSITRLISRDIPADQISGPIGIMKMAGEVAENGFVNLLLFLGLISINLGILNLLPVPILDGGHILFFTLELVLGRPIRIKTQEVAQQVGIFLLVSLMAFAFYNDLVRIFENG